MSELATNQLRIDLETVSERIWDLKQELRDAELAKAAIMNILKGMKS